MTIDKKEKKDFVALAVHKLKTPISSVKLSLEMLLEGDFGELQDEQKKIIERAYEKNETLIYLINDLLNLAKIGENHSYNLKPIDLESIIYAVIDYEKEKIQKKAIVVKIESKDKKLPKILLDKEEIFLAVQNIFSNAVKYSNVGGDIIVYFGTSGKNLELKIQDFGIGILESEKEKLFSEFFRGTNAKEVDSMGSGLGLFIAKDIIERHRGKIWFESKENKGSTFFVTLPIK